MNWFSSILTSALKVIPERMEAHSPLKVSAYIQGTPAAIFVSVINHTRAFPVHVHAVRIHLGLPFYSYFFQLAPYDSREIKPRSRQEFELTYVGTIVGRRRTQKDSDSMPNLNARSAEPPRDAPDIFKGIARGPETDSWLEIDFNEFKDREFLRGDLKPLLDRKSVV